MNNWPVRFILDLGEWQRGYDMAMNNPDQRNPFDPSEAAFYGFVEGQLDAKKINGSR